MIEFELYIDGQFVCSQRADGLIVATPTVPPPTRCRRAVHHASQAGCHCGGAHVSPHPVQPPIVVSGDSTLSILVSPNMTIYPQVSCDGQNHFTCAPGDTVTIQKKPHKLRLIHPLDHNYYEICRTKLGWGSRLGDD